MKPSVGLHPSDTQRLIESIQELRSNGNSIVVVEHDEEMMMAADLLVDMGPGAGVLGGEITGIGPPALSSIRMLHASQNSVTAKFLSRRSLLPSCVRRSVTSEHPRLRLSESNGIT